MGACSDVTTRNVREKAFEGKAGERDQDTAQCTLYEHACLVLNTPARRAEKIFGQRPLLVRHVDYFRHLPLPRPPLSLSLLLLLHDKAVNRLSYLLSF